MIPRRLRIKKAPTTVYSEAFTTEWNSILIQCSLSLMNLITSHETTKLQEIQHEIKELQETANKSSGSQEYDLLNEKMQKNLETLETSIMGLKRKKYEQDLLDYERGEVYTWRGNNGERTPRSILRRNYRGRGNSGSSNKYKVNFFSPEQSAP